VIPLSIALALLAVSCDGLVRLLRRNSAAPGLVSWLYYHPGEHFLPCYLLLQKLSCLKLIMSGETCVVTVVINAVFIELFRIFNFESAKLTWRNSLVLKIIYRNPVSIVCSSGLLSAGHLI
jgi:hypothetical protein